MPIHKENDIHNIANYRPISILPFFSKILEKIVYNRTYDFISSQSLFTHSQYGFLKHLSPEMALIDLYDFVTRSFSKKELPLEFFWI